MLGGMITFDQVTYTYPQARQAVLCDISFDLFEGDFALVVGPSGAGKSTLLRCINGLVPHFSGGTLVGNIRVAGLDPVAATPQVLSRYVGFVFQDPEAQFVMDRVEDELAFALENAALPPQEMRVRVEEALDLLDLAPLRARPLDTLSGGERQRVAIASALAFRPKVLVLDEPTSQLDPKSAEDVLQALVRLNSDLGLTILLAEHRLERVLPFVDQMIYVPDGDDELLIGPTRDILPHIPLVPPLVALGRALDWQPLPLTIKEGRAHSRRWLRAQAGGANDDSTLTKPQRGRGENLPPSPPQGGEQTTIPSADPLQGGEQTTIPPADPLQGGEQTTIPPAAQPGGATVPPPGPPQGGEQTTIPPADPLQGGEQTTILPAGGLGEPVSPYLTAHNLEMAYDEQPILRGVSLEIWPGEVVALMGRNGAGKSTLLKSLIGLVRPRRGEVRVAGQAIARQAVADICRQVGYLPQDPNALLFAETVQQELEITLRNHGLLAKNGASTGPLDPARLLERLGLADKAAAYPRDLSVGERQRVALAAVTITQPGALLLDEPTRGLDYLAKERLLDLLRGWRADGLAIVLVTHDVELAAAIADRVLLMSEGEIIAHGPPGQVLATSPLFAPQIARLFPATGWLTVADVLNRGRVA